MGWKDFLNVDPSVTIGTLYAMIQEKEGIMSNEQWLICNGIHLMEGKTLAEYNIENGSTILLIQWLYNSTELVNGKN